MITVAHACDPSTWKVEAEESEEFTLIFSYVANLRPTWATGNPILKNKKSETEKSSRKDRQAGLRQKLNSLWSRGSWEVCLVL